MTISARCHATLPARWYYDPAHHLRELEAIWYGSWLCVGRADDTPGTGDYRLHRIGNQSVLVTRAADGSLHAFHNTCRHRGSELCEAESGTFRQQRIVCPYHSWTYSLEGDLRATPHRLPSDDFDARRYALYRVALATSGGFVFVNLDAPPGAPLDGAFDERIEALRHWPLADLRVARRETHVLACNWKVFWENFSECYHCPRIHPELCDLVPMYGRAVVSPEDDPAPAARTPGPYSPLAPGAVTWTLDGQSRWSAFPELTEAERAAGMTFVTLLPTMFIVAHVDYVRTVRLRPLGAESTELLVEWLLPREALAREDLDLERVLALGRLVVSQDARVCEINQRGLRCRAHDTGVLVPQEHGVYELHRWVRGRLGEPDAAP